MMSRFVIRFASVVCLLVILTGPSSAWHAWQPPTLLPPVIPTYPTDPNDPYYQAFQTVPSLDVTKKKFMTNFLGFSQTAGITKRQSGAVVDTVLILDGSGSVPRCDFSKAKEALKHMMTTLRNPQYDSKFAAVTFSSRATVSFQFLPYSSAANRITTIPYPGGMTNTQEALLEAKRLFDNPNSGRRSTPNKWIFLVTDGRSNVNARLTIPNANALKTSGVRIFVVAVGNAISGIDEIVRVASNPPEDNLLRVTNMNGLWDLIRLTVRQVYPGRYQFVDYTPPCT